MVYNVATLEVDAHAVHRLKTSLQSAVDSYLLADGIDIGPIRRRQFKDLVVVGKLGVNQMHLLQQVPGRAFREEGVYGDDSYRVDDVSKSHVTHPQLSGHLNEQSEHAFPDRTDLQFDVATIDRDPQELTIMVGHAPKSMLMIHDRIDSRHGFLPLAW
jgi:hypothetical protein